MINSLTSAAETLAAAAAAAASHNQALIGPWRRGARDRVRESARLAIASLPSQRHIQSSTSQLQQQRLVNHSILDASRSPPKVDTHTIDVG